MDSQLVIMGFVSFCFFCLASAILFRMTEREAAVVWMLRAFIVIGIGHALYLGQYWGLEGLLWWASFYGLFTLLFVFGIFGVVEASLSLRILSEIAGSGKKGITRRDMMVQYSRQHIVKRRVDRLLFSGELVGSSGIYRLGKMSYYRVREYFLDFLRWLFPAR